MADGAIVGPLLAGVLLRWVELSTLYLIDAITSVAPMWATIRLSSMPPTGDGSAGKGFASVWDGFRYLAGNTVVLMSFVVDLIAMVFDMPRALFPQIAHQSFGGPVVGVVIAAAAVPAFVRYRISVAADQPGEPGNRPEVERYDPKRGGGRGGGDSGTA